MVKAKTVAAEKQTAESPPDAEERYKIVSPLSGTPRFSLTLYFYAQVVDSNGENPRKFPAQQTVSADTAEEFAELIGEFYSAIADEEEGSLVEYLPREVTGGSYPRKTAGQAEQPQAPTQQYPGGGEPPNCPFHGTPITAKQNKRSLAWFWSCSKPSTTGQGYCNWKPPELQ